MAYSPWSVEESDMTECTHREGGKPQLRERVTIHSSQPLASPACASKAKLTQAPWEELSKECPM